MAFTAVSKYGDHLPNYRLEEILARSGVEIPRSTTCGWLRQSAELLEPLYRRMKAELLQSRALHTDAPAPVLDPLLPRAVTGRFWVHGSDRDHPNSAYDYTPRRKRDGPAEFLSCPRSSPHNPPRPTSPQTSLPCWNSTLSCPTAGFKPISTPALLPNAPPDRECSSPNGYSGE